MKGFSSKIINIPEMEFVVTIKKKDIVNRVMTCISYFTSLGGIEIFCKKKDTLNLFEIGKKYTVSGLLYENDKIIFSESSKVSNYTDPPIKYHYINELKIKPNIEKEIEVFNLISQINFQNYEEKKEKINSILKNSPMFNTFCFISNILAMVDTNPYFIDLYYDLCAPYVTKKPYLLFNFIQHLPARRDSIKIGYLLLYSRFKENGIDFKRNIPILPNKLRVFDLIREKNTAEYFTVRNDVEHLKKCELNQGLVTIAAITGSYDCYMYLMSKNFCEANEKDIATGGSIPLMKRLKTENKKSILNNVLYSRKKESIDWALKEFSLDPPELFRGILSNNPLSVILSLENGENPENCYFLTCEPLSDAISSFKTLLSAIFIEYGASLDPLNSDPLNLVKEYDSSIVELIEGRGVHIDDDLIISVIKSENIYLTKHLLEKNTNKRTSLFALLTAVQTDSKEIVEAVLGFGVDPDEKTIGLESPFDCAVKRNYKNSLGVLIKAKPKPKKAGIYLSSLVRNNDFDNAMELIKNGADPNTVGELNQTPLQTAVLQNSCVFVESLLSNGANINFGKKTPLMIATLANNVPMASLLVSKGADPNLESAVGFGKPTTPYKKAETGKKKELLEIFQKK